MAEGERKNTGDNGSNKKIEVVGEKSSRSVLRVQDSLKKYSFEGFVRWMYSPRDPSSLGIIRFLFGLLMLADLPEERGGANIDLRWGQPKDCHFPLFSVLQPMDFPYMALLYGIMWLVNKGGLARMGPVRLRYSYGSANSLLLDKKEDAQRLTYKKWTDIAQAFRNAVNLECFFRSSKRVWHGCACGMMLGYKFRLSTIIFGVPYWYILLLDKSYWNNHSYLYGIVTILLAGSSANHYFSIDGLLDKTIRNSHVPYWNYFILKFQFFMLYFMAGLKKTDMEWLEGYSMTNLGSHWVFTPFRLFLSTNQIDYLIVHWFGFLLDLTIGFWLLIDFTKPIAMLFCACFHLMNSRMFRIGMFPYVCLATMPLFCNENWPRKLRALFVKVKTTHDDSDVNPSPHCVYSSRQIGTYKRDLRLRRDIGWKHKLVAGLLLTHCGLQVFLPYSHFITKGYNNWTNGLYGYSWDMMVHSWDTILVVVKVVDNVAGAEHFLDPQAWTQSERWNKHADMCVQYAQCVKNNLLSEMQHVWCSLNGRFQQRMYDPNYDLLKARWSPFEPVEWLLPVLTEYSGLRKQMSDITEKVYSWSNYSDVLFVADFPGLHLENYITLDLRNVTLTILEGEVLYELEDKPSKQSYALRLEKGQSTSVEVGVFHKVHTVSSRPSCYMYVYINKTKEDIDGNPQIAATDEKEVMYSPFPVIEDVKFHVDSFLMMGRHVSNALLHVLYGRPLMRRTRLPESKYQ